MDALRLDGHDVLHRPVLGVTGELPWPELPTEAGTPEEIEGGCVLLDFGGCDQRAENDPSASAVHDVVVLIAELRAAMSQRYWGGVLIGRAHAEVSCPLVGAPHTARSGRPIRAIES